MPDFEKELSDLKELIYNRKPLILTGAGISTASGIPDYRDANGVRRGRAPMMFQEFMASPEARKRYWARSMVGWPAVRDAMPNSTHKALAELEAGQHISGVVTQNVDALHGKAGSHCVTELHGNLHRVVCLDCGKRMQREDVQTELKERNPDLQDINAVLAPDGDAHLAASYLDGFRLAGCPCCGSELLKPDVVFFGEGVSADSAEAAWEGVRQAQALVAIGTSLMVYSSFRLCKLIVELGKPLILINIGKTRADTICTLKIETPCQDILPWLAAQG
jgi:NAD-dependent SIR2 family protein deacetylase